jgi:hypothetical protein
MATEEDKINTGALLTIGIVLAISVIAVALAVTALVRNEASSITEEKGSSANLRPIRELRDRQTQALGAPPVWVDKASGQVSLPVDRARQLVLDEIRKDPGKATAPMPADAGAPEATDAGAATGDAGATADDGGTAAGDGGAPEPAAADGGATVAPEPAPEGDAPKPEKKPKKQPKAPKPPPPEEPLPEPEEGP